MSVPLMADECAADENRRPMIASHDDLHLRLHP
jgi:hypothetical protein